MNIDKNIYNDIIYNIAQASLGKIVSSIVSISFTFTEKYEIKIILHIVQGMSLLEEQILNILKSELIVKLVNYTTTIEGVIITKKQFKEGTYESLEFVTFLRNYENI